jgi:hypothetical protein
VRRSQWLIVALAVDGLLVIGVAGIWFFLPRPQVTIEISGSPGGLAWLGMKDSHG